MNPTNLKKEGIGTTEVSSSEGLEHAPSLPTLERLKKRGVALIECLQEVPCNPCEAACRRGAIKLKSLTSLPELDEEICTGCGLCIAKCPGLAIFAVHYNYSHDEALIMFPYEFPTRPHRGSVVDATDRDGRPVAKARVINVMEPRDSDHTIVISMAVPKKFVGDIRGISIQGHEQGERK
jgi:Fe-S-cluster-containing hydrogenase component 2